MRRTLYPAMLLSVAITTTDVSAQAVPTGACATVEVESEPALSPVWQLAVQRLREELARLPPEDCRPSQLRIAGGEDGTIWLHARASDGRTTERALRSPDAVLAVALGILASVPAEATGPLPEASDLPVDGPKPADRPAPLAPSLAEPELVEGPLEAQGDVAISISGGARLGEPTHVVMADLELRVDVFWDRWMLLATLRAAPLGTRFEGALPHYAYEELGLGVAAGHRFLFDPGVIDLATGPGAVIADQEALLTGAGADPDSLVYLRWDFCARWLFGRAGGWRLGPSIDADVALSALDEPIEVAPLLPPIPAWSVALRFVASGELQ